MLKVAIIGIGNAGNQVAELANKTKGIEGIAINSSEKDISTVNSVPSIVIGDEKGAGKDRRIAKEFIQRSAKTLLNEKVFTDLIVNNEVIFVVSSTGGGTGSGMSPVLTDILSRVYPTKRFILVGILPTIKESIAAQQNTIEYLKEMRNFKATYMLYDNNIKTELPTSDMMKAINNQIVEDICVIRGDYQHATPFNSIDEKDMLKIIETEGRLVLATTFGFKEKDIGEKSIEERLIETLRNNVHAEIELDQIIKRLGLIVNLNSKLLKTLDTNLPKLKEIVGEPVEGFEHIYLFDESEDKTNLVSVLLSGLSIPDDRIEKIIQRIDEATSKLTKVKESSILDETQTEFLDQLRRSNNSSQQNVDEIDLDDIFSNYIK